MTILAIAVSSVSVLLFGGNISSIIYTLQTGYVRSAGHIHVYRKGYSQYGATNPSAYGMEDYEKVMQLIKSDQAVKPQLRLVMPFLAFQGIAGNFVADTSQSFFGMGIVPSLFEKLMTWDQHHLKVTKTDVSTGLKDEDLSGGVIGHGMAERMNLCGALRLDDCAAPPPSKKETPQNVPTEDFSALTSEDFPAKDSEKTGDTARLDLLAATSGGAPNVVSVNLRKAMKMGTKAFNEGLIILNLDLAQKLISGRGAKKTTGLMVQLNRTEDMETVKKRLEQILPQNEYEVKTFGEVRPMYGQTISMFATVFGFVALIMGVIVLFTTINTMSMSVMERISEIGTARALGLRRSAIVRQFVAEGFLLGTLGSTLGAAAALAVSFVINLMEITWTPPDYATPVLLSVHMSLQPFFLPVCWLGLIAVATLSSVVPARSAAKMAIVDALRHN
jgi:putative ABC transport system permease protein